VKMALVLMISKRKVVYISHLYLSFCNFYIRAIRLKLNARRARNIAASDCAR